MDYEKKYREDLEAAKGWLEIAKENDNKVALQILENLFPELRESENERIMEELIDYLKRFIPHTDVELVQKSKLWIAWLEKQGEQKPAWSKEDLMIQDAIHWIQEFQKSNRCKDENDMQNSVTCEHWLRSIIGI